MKLKIREVTVICDICGATLKYEPCPYKVKVKKLHCGKWKQLDICPDCQDNIVDYCTQKGETTMVKPIDANKLMKCNHLKESLYCSFYYNGECLRDHDYECPALMKPKIKTSDEDKINWNLNEKKTRRLIDADALMQYCSNTKSKTISNNDIARFPVIEERKKGKWILSDVQRQEDMDNGNYRFICSECGKSDIHSKAVTVSFCWNCGADMREEKTKA